MSWILVVIAVSNSRFYHESPQYAIPYKNMAACMMAADKYPKQGVNFNKAVCIPLMDGK